MSRWIVSSLTIIVVCSLASMLDASESIAYRLPAWKRMHFHDSTKAKQHLAAVKKLGCEAKEAQHGDHLDVAYRTQHWRALAVANNALADQWESWLTGAGFEVIRAHDDAGEGHVHVSDGHAHAAHNHSSSKDVESLMYRLGEWKTAHFDDKVRSDEFVALMHGFGCEVRTEPHQGHIDAKFRCLAWKSVVLPTHREAEGWQTWLAKHGFEVRHVHRNVAENLNGNRSKNR